MIQRDRHAVVLAGIGGSGVVWAGTLLIRAGMKKYEYATRLPNFTTQMRGGPCECMVILSNNPIASPLVFKGDASIILENSQLKAYEGRVRSGGIIVLESTELKDKVEREDVRVLEVPAVEVAAGIGNTLVSGMVLIGAYIQATNAFPPNFIKEEIETRFGITETATRLAEREILFSHNIGAFREGLKIGANWKG